jgi:hypothetical protein
MFMGRQPTLTDMKDPVITGTGLWRPENTISNAELVASFNAYADLQNAQHAGEIVAGTRSAIVHSSVEFIEKASGIRQRYVIDKAGVLDPARMRPRLEPPRSRSPRAGARWRQLAAALPTSMPCSAPPPTCSVPTRPWRSRSSRRWVPAAMAST